MEILNKIIEVLGKIIEFLKTLISFLDGNKTYIIGIAIVAEGIFRGDMTTILLGLGFITGRQAITKVENTLGGMKK